MAGVDPTCSEIADTIARRPAPEVSRMVPSMSKRTSLRMGRVDHRSSGSESWDRSWTTVAAGALAFVTAPQAASQPRGADAANLHGFPVTKAPRAYHHTP